jgi:hypothetical protein
MSCRTFVALPSWGKVERNQFVFGNNGDFFLLVEFEKAFVPASSIVAITITYHVEYGIFYFYFTCLNFYTGRYNVGILLSLKQWFENFFRTLGFMKEFADFITFISSICICESEAQFFPQKKEGT